ncbi:uncharacterized protein LOC126775527 [Nymphalis io]|uniref:uncharacterized protein LOC126775527 n=1 Tax=Inachis io TaxID=171585 RepID=UPI002167C16A|nr:uncharacterized protein LOC126775527 [Nymphalis io]
MLHEISRKRITVNKYEETSISWYNSVLVVRGYKTLHLIDFSYNLYSLEKEIDLKECTVSVSYDSPVPNNYLSNYAAQGVNNLELVEMITNPAFWPHNKLLTQEMTNIVSFKWSPENLINNHESVLATVNSVGNIELFARKKQLWYSIMEFSKEMMKHLSTRFELLDQCPQKFKEMEDVVYSLESSTICWCPVLNPDNSCYLATAQKSGEILYWLLKCNDTLQTEYCGSIKNSNDVEIPLMVWVSIDTGKFILIITNESGQVLANECQLVENKVTLIKEHILWRHTDKMMVTYLEYTFINDMLLVLFNKHRHLIVQLYDKSFRLVCQCVKNVNDYKISSIKKFKNIFYISTINTNIYKINYTITEDNVEVTLEPFDIKDTYTSCELFGIGCSNNNVLFALAMIDRRLLYRKQSLKIEIIFLCPESEPEVEATAIINNPLKRLTHMWDYLEILRCKIIKTKTLPQIDYYKLLKDGASDVYKLKVYLVFLIFYQNLEKLMVPHLKGKLPETSIDIIKDRILFVQAINVINDVYDKYTKNNHLTDFEKECFDCSKRFINYYCMLYSGNRDDYVSDDICSISNLNVEYMCQACDEKLLQFSCRNGHLNMFCSLTFSLIESDQYIICKSCGSTARMELYKDKPTCVFCDLHLISV